MNTITTKEIADFLNEANKNTYANKDAAKAPPSRLESEDYHFEKDSLVYHDTYFGSRDFIGEEVIYKDNKPVWGMNYYGYILSETTNEKELYGFLRQALIQEYSDIIPVRGPVNYQKDDWKYNNSTEGELGRFTGTEEIHRAGVLVYKCHYHGGFIN